MSNRTIKAPGVEIFEHDMSEYPAISEGTHVLLTGFAQKGEDYEPYRLTSRSSWLKFYGAPTNEAEEYFYAAANEVIDKGGYLHSVKIPYSNDIRGIYAAAKFRIETCRDLLSRDPDGDFFLNLDGTENEEIENGSDAARLMDQYQGLKKLGINSISKIAPQAQDFLSYDLVEEYENGERKPGSNTIYIVDKTRAIYTRAVKVHDVQPNRDARSCIGIVPVITTMANTAWFQKSSTGLTADINELYQPIRSLKTITFPAGAASAAEYQPTEFIRDDLSIDIVQEKNSYDRSLAEMAAMQAQSCLLNGNMIDGKFAPFVGNEVAVIVFKAFTSTEDSKIDFEVVEQFTGSLDPNARNEKGISTYLGTLINNTSDYIYFFSNLESPKTVLKSDHAFVAGSNSDFDEIENKIAEDEDYLAAQQFGGYTARMLGFDDNDAGEDYYEHTRGSLYAFYNQNDKQKVNKTDTLVTGDIRPGWQYVDITDDVRQTYNGERPQDDDEEVEKIIHGEIMSKAFAGKKFILDKELIAQKPTYRYTIGSSVVYKCDNPDCESNHREPVDGKDVNYIHYAKFHDGKYYCPICNTEREPYKYTVHEVKDKHDNPVRVKSLGGVAFSIESPRSACIEKATKDSSLTGADYFRKTPEGERAEYIVENYGACMTIGRMTDEENITLDPELGARGPVVRNAFWDETKAFDDVKSHTYDELPEWMADEKLFQLTIFNSTDYIRAIKEFDTLINVADCAERCGVDVTDPDGEGMLMLKDIMLRHMIIDSIQKTARYKVFLRRLKKDQIALDRLDDAMATFVSSTKPGVFGDYTARIYIRDLYNSLSSQGLLGGINLVNEVEPGNSSAASSIAALARADIVEQKIEDLINPDTSKKEKADPTKKSTKKAEKRDDTDADKNQAILDQLRHYNAKGVLEWDYPTWYAKCRIYLRHKLFKDYADMYDYLAKVFEDCAMAADRYLQTQQSIDDANIMLGFYPEMAEPIITYTEIAQTINKLYDTFGDLNNTTIDVVVDAGISNIAQFVKQVYDPSSDDGEDIGGCYEPVKYSAYYKFNKYTDLSYWKTIVFKWNTFCKSIRKDCMFCTEAPRHMVLTGNKPVVRKSKKDTSVDINILPYLTMITGFNTSYGAGYMNWYKTISDYTGDILWIPPSIIACGSYILTDRDYNWWDAPAGMKRGVVDMADVSFNPTNKQAGEIYDVAWNYAINYKGDYINGIIQEGQKTFQSYHSAFDRINVRRLFLRCERYVYFASRAFLYEPNTEYTRKRYVDTITPFFQDIKQRGGMYDFIIICDESNNTPDTIDRNELRVKIGIQPTRTIEFILVDFVASRTGSDWSELATI